MTNKSPLEKTCLFFFVTAHGKLILTSILSRFIICCHFPKIKPKYLTFFWPSWSLDGDAWCPLFTWATHKCVVFNIKAFSSLLANNKSSSKPSLHGDITPFKSTPNIHEKMVRDPAKPWERCVQASCCFFQTKANEDWLSSSNGMLQNALG